MRFHRFRDDICIDLDAIHAFEKHSDDSTIIHGARFETVVTMPFEEVLALLQPAAAPDTYEESPDEFPNGAWLNRPMVDAEVRAARLDELALLEKRVSENHATYGMNAIDPSIYIARRRAEIERGA